MSKSSKPPKKLVSDALGCLPCQVSDRLADAKYHGVPLELVPDKTSLEKDGTPNFYQAEFSSESARNAYAAHCGLVDKSRTLGSGATISPSQLCDAERLIRQKYGEAK